MCGRALQSVCPMMVSTNVWRRCRCAMRPSEKSVNSSLDTNLHMLMCQMSEQQTAINHTNII